MILNILVVDANNKIRNEIKDILENFMVDFPFMEEPYSFKVMEASTGTEAIELIDKYLPDITLLENTLEGINGIEILKYIKNKKIESKEVMISSNTSLDLAVKATSLGVNDFITKPFTKQELQSSMTTIVKNLFLQRVTKKMTTAGKKIRFQFLSVLSHELKSPINAVQGYMEMMQNKSFGNNLEDYQHILERSIKRIKGMRHIIMDLLDMTQIESFEKKRNISLINIRESVLNSIDTLNPFAIQRNIKILYHNPNSIFFNADSCEISMIFNNLISNAVKYNKEDGIVDIWVTQEKNTLRIKVTDTGIGMTTEEISKLFNEFVRIKNEKTKNINGSGLGLSILKRIVALYNGKIEVESVPEQGSTFIVEIQETINQ